MSTWIKVGFENAAGIFSTADIATAATPLAAMHQGYFDETAGTLMDLFVGSVGGCIGETSAIALLIGFLYLLARKIINCRIPVAYVATVAVLAFLFPQGNDRVTWMAAQVLGGGLLLGAIFMATDYVTSPPTAKGKLIFGIGCGLITVVIRVFGNYPEGVSYAILLMNIVNPHICNLTGTKPFGGIKHE
jgi:electron transport complex protein RnfD